MDSIESTLPRMPFVAFEWPFDHTGRRSGEPSIAQASAGQSRM